MMAPFSLTEDVAGIDIADGTITAARIHQTRRGVVELRNAGWASYDPGTSERALASAVRALWRQCGMTTTTVCSCLRSRSLAFHYFKYENISSKDLASALWLQGEEALQLPRQDIAIDWHVNPTAENSATKEGILMAAPTKAVDQHLGVLEMAGLYPVILDVGSMAIGNLFLELSDGDRPRDAVCIMSFSPHVADVAILDHRECIYPHTIVFQSATWQSSRDYLCENIADVLKYHHYKLRHDPVKRLVVTGGIPEPEQLSAALQERFHLPVDVWDPLSRVKVRGSALARRLAADKTAGPLLATSLGLALRRD